MNIKRKLYVSGGWLAGLMAILFFTGCSGSGYLTDRVLFPNATLNDRPMRLVLDTGAFTSALTNGGANWLGVKIAMPASPYLQANGNVSFEISEPVRVVEGTESFIAQLPVIDLSRTNLGSLDGSIGWPEVRDNILVFDGATRTIRGVDELPPETAGWLKVTVRPGKVLILDIPLVDGNVGELLVDTGSDNGVALPPAQMNEWRAAHPQAPFKSGRAYMPGAGVYSSTEFEADEVRIGALTLTAVNVREANTVESTPGGNLVGTIGLGAIARMDLVVDGKNGFAYLRPKPAPSPPDPAHPDANSASDDPFAQKGDWTAVGQIRLKIDGLLAISGQAKAATGDYNGALADYDHAVAINPDNADAYTGLGGVKLRIGDVNGAEAALSRAVAINPKDALAYDGLGGIKLNRGDDDGAIADFSRAIEIAPKDANGYAGLGGAKFQQGDLDGAIADFSQALQLNPASEFAYSLRGLARQGNGDDDGAIADLKAAIDLNPKDANAYASRGVALSDKGDAAAAMADFNRALELDPKNIWAYYNRANTEQIRGKFADALADYEKDIELLPDNSALARLYRQLLQLRLGTAPADFKDTIAGWKEPWYITEGRFVAGSLSEAGLLAAAIQGDEKSVRSQQSQAYYFIGMMRFIKGDRAGAREYWQDCVALDVKTLNEYRLARAELARLDATAK